VLDRRFHPGSSGAERPDRRVVSTPRRLGQSRQRRFALQCVLDDERFGRVTPAEVVRDDSRWWFRDLMPNSHCTDSNGIRQQGNNSNRQKARIPDAVEERDGDFVGVMTTPVFDAIRQLGVDV